MDLKRVNRLKIFLKEYPDDAFTKYALAIEHVHHNDQYASELFTELLRDHSEYVPTYYHAAEHFARLGLTEQAEEIFKKGISLSQGDPKALREIQNAYQNFLFEKED